MAVAALERLTESPTAWEFLAIVVRAAHRYHGVLSRRRVRRVEPDSVIPTVTLTDTGDPDKRLRNGPHRRGMR